jgi:hypothetical protein
LSDFAKTVKIGKYNGKRRVKEWLFQVMSTIDILGARWDDARKCVWFGTLLEGDAQTWFWWRRTNRPAESFADMLCAFQREYQRETDGVRAREQLMALRMGSSASEYTRRFRHLAMTVPNISEDELLTLFARGLRPSLQREVMVRVGLGEITGFGAATRFAEHLDHAESLAHRVGSHSRAGPSGSAPSGNHHRPHGQRRDGAGHSGSGTANHLAAVTTSSAPVRNGFTKQADGSWLPKTDSGRRANAAKLSEKPPPDNVRDRYYHHKSSQLWAPDKRDSDNALLCHRCLHYGHMRANCDIPGNGR